MGRILVIRGGAIGDFVLTLPALTALRQRFPEVHLEVLGYAHIASLALAGGVVDAVRSIEAGSLAGFFARHGNLAPELADYFASFNVIISYLYDPDQVFRTNVARCSPAQFIQGPHRPDETAGVAASRVFLQPLERLAVFDADPIPRLKVPARSERPRRRPAPRLAVHPGSGSERKNWLESAWAEFLVKVADESEILLVGGEAEGDRFERLAQRLPTHGVEKAQNRPLPELAALLAECDAFIGHDSGISHLAAAVGLPGLILWADSVEEIWRPPSQHVTVLRAAGGLSELTVDEVLVALRTVLATEQRANKAH